MLLARSALPVDPLVRCAGCPCSARRPARDAACAAAPPSQFAVQRGPRARAAPTPADIDPLLPEQELPLVLNHHDQPQLPATAAAPASELTGAAAGGYVALDPALGWEEAARATPSDAWTASTDEDLQAAADLLAAGGSGAVDAGACGGQHWWEAAGAAAEGGGGASGAGGSSSPWAAVSAAAAASGIYMGSRSGARSALRLAQDRLLRLAPGGATSRRARRRANALAPPPAQRLYRLAVDEGGNIVRARAVKAEGGPAFMHAHTAALRSAGEGAGVLPPMGRPGLSDGAGAATAATAAAAAAAAAQRLHWRSEAMHLEAMQGASDAKGTSAEGRREAASELPGTTWLPGAGRAAQEVEQQQEEDTSRGDPTRGLQLAAFLYCAGQVGCWQHASGGQWRRVSSAAALHCMSSQCWLAEQAPHPWTHMGACTCSPQR